MRICRRRLNGAVSPADKERDISVPELLLIRARREPAGGRVACAAGRC